MEAGREGGKDKGGREEGKGKGNGGKEGRVTEGRRQG